MSDRLFDPINNPSRTNQEPLFGEGELEIEYSYIELSPNGAVDISLDLKCTILYKFWSVDVESVDAEYKIIGSANYLPSDFEQLVKDYLHELPELKGIRVNQLTKI